MPQAKPTQVIVHRLELQQSERKYLEEYLESQKNIGIANAASKYVAPALVAGAVVGGVWIGAKVWASVQAALLGPIEEAKQYIEELYSVPKGEHPDDLGTAQDAYDNLSESGNIFTETYRNPTVRGWILSPTLGRVIDALTPDDSAIGQSSRAADRVINNFWDEVFGDV